MQTAEDFIADVLQKVRAACPEFSEASAKRIEKEIRKQWGGNDFYISKKSSEELRSVQSARREALAKLREGVPRAKVAQNSLLSRQYIYILHNDLKKQVSDVREPPDACRASPDS
jgi:hypothetical protein